MDNFENFYNEYKKTKLAIYNQFCYACQEKYVQSLKYHTCYYATGGTDDENIDLVLQIIINKYNLNINEQKLNQLKEWVIERDYDNVYRSQPYL
jgi:hypothetical protein